MSIDELRRGLTERMETAPTDFLGTGSTLINLACTGHPRRGFAKGHFYHVVGASVGGKSFVANSLLAEASISPKFEDYRLIYDNSENSPLMDIKRLFGTRLAERMETPFETEDGIPAASFYVEEFYYNIDDVLKEGPCIYILDSMDALETKADQDKFEEHKKADRAGKDAAGSYGTSKAKLNSTHLGPLMPKLKKTGSILVIISQSRDNIGFGAQMNPHVYAGGRALKFYATFQMWMNPIKREKGNVKDDKVQQGIMTRVAIKKNKITGRERTVDIPIYHSYGIDDIGSSIDYLVKRHWKKRKQSIVAEEFDIVATKAKLIKHIEDEDLERKLQNIVARVWKNIEKAGELQGRKKRYE